MKKCPSCEKTFEDSMRFCQVDGTPLVDDAPAFDPYATIVAPAGVSAPSEPEPPAEIEPVAPADAEPPVMSIEPIETAESEAATRIADYPPVSAPIAEPEDVLDLPSAPDPLKTMYVSEDEMRAALGSVDAADDQIMEIPEATPEPPSFIEKEITPPPSPFATESPSEPVFAPTEPAIPAPYEVPAPVAEEVQAPQFTAPEPPPFKEPEPVFAPAVSEPAASSTPAEWTPPPAPDASWQDQEIGSNTPFQPPPAGVGGENKTLAIVSLVLGILSICCYVSPVTGLGALITGYLALKNIKSDPQTYGGKGLAIAGLATGGVFFLIGVAYYVVVILLYMGIIAGSMIPNF